MGFNLIFYILFSDEIIDSEKNFRNQLLKVKREKTEIEEKLKFLESLYCNLGKKPEDIGVCCFDIGLCYCNMVVVRFFLLISFSLHLLAFFNKYVN